MTETEELLVATLHRQAEQTPGEARVRAALAGGRARRGVGRALVVACAAVVVAAIAVVVPVVLDRARSAPPAVPAPPPTIFTMPTSAMRYEPTWLPPGFVEKSREVTSSSVTRIWTPDSAADLDTDAGSSIAVTVQLDDRPPLPQSPPGLTVGGKPAHLERGVLSWQPEPGTLVSVSGTGTAHANTTVYRVAVELRSDGHASFTPPPVAFGWLPPGWRVTEVDTTGDSPTAAWGSINADIQCGGSFSVDMMVSITSKPLVVSGPTRTIRGRTAHANGSGAISYSGMKDVPVGATVPPSMSVGYSVPLDDGRYLNVLATPGGAGGTRAGELTMADIAHVAEDVHIAAYTADPWIGQR